MKWALLISGVIELIGAIILYFSPLLIFSIQEASHVLFKFYAMTMAVVGLLNVFAALSFQKSKFFKQVFLTMMGFHGALAMLCYGSPDSQFPLSLYGSITHGVLFALFLIGYLKEA